MSQFAVKTKVPVSQSKVELERLLQKYKATAFLSGWQKGEDVIGFEMRGKKIRMHFPDIPTKSRSQEEAQRLARQKWRVIILIIKGNLEAIETGVVTFEEVFLPYFVLPNGQTYSQFAVPQIESAYKENKMPPLLPGR